MNKKIRTAILGCGKVGHIHARGLASLSESAFTAVWSRTPAKAREFANVYGVKAYEDIGDMVHREGIEMAIVCTPHPFHASAAIAALQAGAHVLVEKPLAASLADCDLMITAARSAGRRLGSISQRRWYAPVRRVKKAIDDGKIGRPVLGTVYMLGWRDRKYYESDAWRGTWKDEGGGVLVNQAPHQIDILQWFMGPIEEMFGYWGNLNHPFIEVEDTSVALIRFKSGALGNIVVSNSQNPALFGKVWVHGENGATLGVQTDGGAMFIAGMSSIVEPPLNDRWTVPGEEGLLAQWQKDDTDEFARVNATEHYHHLQDQDFLQAIRENRDPLVTGEEGRKTVEIFTAIYRSQRDGKPVRFPLAPEVGRTDFDGRLGATR
jgi:UDP-N-acetyl-2-amino-2-deoxyglucuronate dehydrogenase